MRPLLPFLAFALLLLMALEFGRSLAQGDAGALVVVVASLLPISSARYGA
jgi:hypothetical protein